MGEADALLAAAQKVVDAAKAATDPEIVSAFMSAWEFDSFRLDADAEKLYADLREALKEYDRALGGEREGDE